MIKLRSWVLFLSGFFFISMAQAEDTSQVIVRFKPQFKMSDLKPFLIKEKTVSLDKILIEEMNLFSFKRRQITIETHLCLKIRFHLSNK